MAEQERRSSGKIDRLPPDIKTQVEDRISDTTISMTSISDWLKELGYDISYGSVSRYAKRMNRIAQRVAENLEKTKLILDKIERNPNVDIEKAAQVVMVDGLMERITTADEDFYEMPLDKVGRLLASFRRVNVAEKKLFFDMRQKIDLAFEGLEADIMKAIQNDPVIGPKLHTLLIEAREKLSADD